MEHVKLLSKYDTDYTLVVAENVMLRERCADLEVQLADLKRENSALKARLFPNPRIIHGKGTGWAGTDEGIVAEWEAE